MKKLSLLSLIFLIPFLIIAQKGKVKGVIYDKSTGEGLISCAVKASNGSAALSDLYGNYELNLPYGTHTIAFTYSGFNTLIKTINVNSAETTVNAYLIPIQLKEFEVVSDIAIDRETPVAFSNISTKQLEEELASQDIPMILNSTPGVYATQTGGGDGDARINIRGFNQRNVAVMLDGVPVNDMENGWVYWSNWFGLDVTTKRIQVQRGLGAAKIAIPSVGGTMNILTNGIDQRAGGKLKVEVGNNGFFRTTLGLNSGRLKGDWGFSMAFSRKTGSGWADETFTEANFYYFKVEKEIGKHLLSVAGFGAPQEHGQRSFKAPISYYDSKIASDNGVTEAQINFYNATYGKDHGLRANQHWQNYTDADGNTITYRDRVNYYHKPQFTLKDFWTVNDKFYVSNIAYMSIGNGGGTGGNSGASEIDPNTGTLGTIQEIYNSNRFGGIFGPNIDPNFHPTKIKGANEQYSSINNHFWVGLLSTGTYVQNENLTYSGGVDLRLYDGEHYRELYNTLGADYIVNGDNQNKPAQMIEVGEKYEYHDKGQVRWTGIFGQAEYKKGLWSAFVNVAGSYIGYNAIDYFRKKTIDIDGTTYEVGYRDTITASNGQVLTRDTEGLKTYETGYEWFPGGTFKIGANYNINEDMNAFVNLGLLSKASSYNNVITQDNEFIHDVKNELIQAFEFGYAYAKRKTAINVNGYYTNWKNRPNSFSQTDADNERYVANVLMDALHLGIEVSAAYEVSKKLKVEGIISVGDWTWQSAEEGIVYFDEAGNPLTDGNGNVDSRSFDAKGVHVSDAAQTQLGASINYEFIKGLYVRARYTYFDRYYADFEPTTLVGNNAGRESWQTPSYGLLDIHTGYSFDFFGTRASIRLSILNAMDTEYISDAQNNDNFTGQSYNNFDAASASVFFGLGRRFNTSFQISF